MVILLKTVSVPGRGLTVSFAGEFGKTKHDLMGNLCGHLVQSGMLPAASGGRCHECAICLRLLPEHNRSTYPDNCSAEYRNFSLFSSAVEIDSNRNNRHSALQGDMSYARFPPDQSLRIAVARSFRKNPDAPACTEFLGAALYRVSGSCRRPGGFYKGQPGTFVIDIYWIGHIH